MPVLARPPGPDGAVGAGPAGVLVASPVSTPPLVGAGLVELPALVGGTDGELDVLTGNEATGDAIVAGVVTAAGEVAAAVEDELLEAGFVGGHGFLAGTELGSNELGADVIALGVEWAPVCDV